MRISEPPRKTIHPTSVTPKGVTPSPQGEGSSLRRFGVWNSSGRGMPPPLHSKMILPTAPHPSWAKAHDTFSPGRRLFSETIRLYFWGKAKKISPSRVRFFPFILHLWRRFPAWGESLLRRTGPSWSAAGPPAHTPAPRTARCSGSRHPRLRTRQPR